MKNYRAYMPCCASCYFVAQAPMDAWFCKFGIEETAQQMGIGIDEDDIDFEMLEEMDRGVEPHGGCDDYRNRLQAMDTRKWFACGCTGIKTCLYHQGPGPFIEAQIIGGPDDGTWLRIRKNACAFQTSMALYTHRENEDGSHIYEFVAEMKSSMEVTYDEQG